MMELNLDDLNSGEEQSFSNHLLDSRPSKLRSCYAPTAQMQKTQKSIGGLHGAWPQQSQRVGCSDTPWANTASKDYRY